MYYYPNLDEQTRLIMISELESDLITSLFYEPKSLTSTDMLKLRIFQNPRTKICLRKNCIHMANCF